MTAQGFAIGGIEIGDEHPPFVIAEAGVHHGNSVALAKQYIVAARIAGAHAIKFQTYKAAKLATRWAPAYWSTDGQVTQFEVFAERDKLNADEYKELVDFASSLGIIFLSTPFDSDSAGLLNGLGVPAFKIASADVTNAPLLKAVARFGKPVILSTGASTYDEVARAVEMISAGGAPVAVLHCSLAYPTPVGEANLRRIAALRERIPNVVVGYSDHVRPQDSELPCPLAVALGARIIEKHFTLNKRSVGDDHYHAVDPDGLARLVENCRHAFEMTGAPVELGREEDAARKYARRSIVAARAVPAGKRLELSDVDFKRPGTGLPPTEVDSVIGRTTRRELREDELIRHEDLA